MRILHRYLLIELVWNSVMFLAVILSLYFVMSLALMLGKSSVEGLPIWIVFRATGFQLVSSLYLIVPLTILSASIFTYGRANSEGEFTAFRASGIHPYQAIVPALLLGAAGALSLAWLQDEVIPDAHWAQRVELQSDVLENLDSVLTGSQREIAQSKWAAKWSELRQDDDNHLWMMNLLLIEKDRQGRMEGRYLARRAQPVFHEDENSLKLTLVDFRYYQQERLRLAAKETVLTLDLDELSTAGMNPRREKDLSYVELLSEWRHRDEALRKTDETEPVSEETWRRCRKFRGIYHFRISFAFSSIFFALLGAGLGLVRPVANRAIVFLTGFLLVVGLYYPLQQIGRNIGDGGHMHPGLSVWIGNAVIGLIGIGIFRKVLRG